MTPLPTLCAGCGARLSGDDIGLYRKAIDRSGKGCLCLTCLAARSGVPRETLEQKVAFLKEQGCTLFE